MFCRKLLKPLVTLTPYQSNMLLESPLTPARARTWFLGPDNKLFNFSSPQWLKDLLMIPSQSQDMKIVDMYIATQEALQGKAFHNKRKLDQIGEMYIALLNDAEVKVKGLGLIERLVDNNFGFTFPLERNVVYRLSNRAAHKFIANKPFTCLVVSLVSINIPIDKTLFELVKRVERKEVLLAK